MKNEKFIIEILNTYDSCAKYQVIGVKTLSKDKAKLVEFQSEDKSITSSAVVYPDGTTFVLDDWQGSYPRTEEEIEEFNWICANNNHSAVAFNGLPRLLF